MDETTGAAVQREDASEGGSTSERDRLTTSFAAALRATERAPESAEAWDHVEELADALQRPDEVAAAYKQALERELAAELWTSLAQRAARFFDEWYGDDPQAMQDLLERIIRRDREAAWAIERLTDVLTSAGRWDDLLALYDRMLATRRDSVARERLLDDAAHVAKDFAQRPDRAVDYMLLRLELEPGNHTLAASIERLLERQQRFRDLIELWQRRLPEQGAPQARKTRLRIAETWLDHLNAPEPALTELTTLVEEAPAFADASAQIERILVWPEVAPTMRAAALSLLRTSYEASERPREAVRALEVALRFAEGPARLPLHREAGARLAILGDDAHAIEHYAALLELEPTDADARRQMRQLARRSGLEAAFARALVQAAERAQPADAAVLLLEAAHLHRNALGTDDQAIDLYARVVELAEADPATALTAAHHLNELLGAAGRDGERLDVLEQLADLETATELRRAVLGEAGRLADRLGDADRSLAAHARRLAVDPTDLAALDASIEVLARYDRTLPLAQALRRRADTSTSAPQRRADLVRVARLEAEHLHDPAAAITTWLAIRSEFGDEPETTAALDALLAAAERWTELSQILDAAAGARRHDSAALLARLGAIHHAHLGDPALAVRFYAQTLGVDPTHAIARQGLRELAQREDCVREASLALARAHRGEGEWSAWLELVPLLLRAAASPNERIEILREAARLFEHHSADPALAQRAIARALVLDPADVTLEAELLRLAPHGEGHAAAAASLAEAAAACTEPRRAAALRRDEGRLYAHTLAEPGPAAAAFAEAARLDPGDLETQRAIVWTASEIGDWTAAVGALLAIARIHEAVDPHSLERLGNVAARRDEWADLTAAIEAALAPRARRSAPIAAENDPLDPSGPDLEAELDQALASAIEDAPDETGPALPTTVVRELEAACARWARDALGDLGKAAAAAARAVAREPGRRDTLELLADIQRRRSVDREGPRPALAETLLAIDALAQGELEALTEAAEVAVGAPAEREWTRAVLVRLLRKAGLAFTDTAHAHAAEHVSLWATEQLVAIDLALGRTGDAIATLSAAADLPLSRDRKLALRIRTARLCRDSGDRSRAIEIYRQVLEERASDVELVRELADLCAVEGRILELVRMRGRELELTRDSARRLELRLDMSALVGDVERIGGRVDALLANLEEEPGHRESVDALTRVLRDRGQGLRLLDVLTEQAGRLEATAPTRAAELWGDVARLSERDFGDEPRAIVAMQRVVELAPTNEAFDTLARLHLQQGEPGPAATVLARRLTTTDGDKRVPLLLKLAKAQIAADREPEAILTLRSAFDEAPKNVEVRRLLIRLYREHEQWEALADTLSTASEHIGDPETIVAYAKEASQIFDDRLGAPDRGVAVLERALVFEKGDRELKARLVEGLRVAARLDEARALVKELITDFGRRRSPQRAAAHLQLARVAHAQGDTEEALDQLEHASNMDGTNHRILRTLAELARETGQLERAERAYRALLMQVRRRPPAQQDGPAAERIGPTEVFYELHALAERRGDRVQAEELVESAIAALAQDDAEGPRLQTLLRQRGDTVLLHRVLETRLALTQMPRRRAELLGELAALQEESPSLDHTRAAFGSRLEAIAIDPGTPEHHERARELAARLGRQDEYTAFIERLLEKARRTSDAYVRCELLLRLAEAAATDRGDPELAADLLTQAEQLGVREVDVWRSAARIAAARNDTETQTYYLERLATLGEGEDETRADAMYRLAEVQLAAEETQARGIVALRRALETHARTERALRILARTTEVGASPELLALYDRVARQAGDRTALLLAIERRAAHPDTTPEDVREGVELAHAAEDHERAEALMLRAVELSANVLDGNARIGWALVGLTERRHQVGDVAAATRWLIEAIESAPTIEPLLPLALRVTETAAHESGDLTLAVKVYEALRERDPNRRAVWEPLAELYRKFGEIDRLRRLVEETLDGVDDGHERNALRLQLVHTLLEHPEREGDAVELLRTILLEAPEHEQARALMTGVLERSGRDEELIELLDQQLMTAQASGEAEAVVTAALRLSQRQATTDPERARSTLENALQWTPDHPDLLRAVLALTEGDAHLEARRELLARLITVEAPERAANLTIELAELCARQDDTTAEIEALLHGYRRAPGHDALRRRLVAAYEARGDHRGLADMMLAAADDERDVTRQIVLLRQAAVIRRDLGEAAAAVDLLERAHRLDPTDATLALELATLAETAGDPERAHAILTALLDLASASEDPAVRLRLWSARAELRRNRGDLAGAVQDLEAAHRLDPQAIAPRLTETLTSRLHLAAATDDLEAERDATIRLVDVLVAAGDRERARDLLLDWTERERRDAPALRTLQELETTLERWEQVAKICARLVAIESGDAQIDAALALSHACTRLGQPADARPGLEHARRRQPENVAVRRELMVIYEVTGAERELAKLLAHEAEDATDSAAKLELLRRVAAIQLRHGELENAAPTLREVLALAPGEPWASVSLADIHLSRSELELADAVLDGAISDAPQRQRSPDLAVLYQRKGHVAAARGDTDARLGLLQQAFGVDKNNGYVAAELADLAEAIEQWDLAIRVLRTITLLDGECPISRTQAFLRQARICERRGDRQRAVLWARKAKHESPEDGEVDAFLAMIGEG